MDHAADELFWRYARTRDIRLRNQLFAIHEGLAHFVAARFRRPGTDAIEDLTQVARLGLIAAIERYDPALGSSFAGFAVPTVVGVIKHHLRDCEWMIKAPRRLRELGMRARKLSEVMELMNGGAPTIGELAAALCVDVETLAEAMDVERLSQPPSLDAPVERELGNGTHTLQDLIGDPDPALSVIEERDWLESALGRLEDREQKVLYQRFFECASQAEVAQGLGISQMHVSRIEKRAISRLRTILV